MSKCLIVNADDLGISPGTNRAIGRAFREGIVTSASLMANMAAFEHAVEMVRTSCPALGVGLHLCLTSGKPVLPPAEVPLLVDPAGRFRHGFLGLLRLVRSRRGREALAQIEREMQAQAARIDACGITADHVDSHQHVHMIPELFPLAAKIAAERRAAIRIADEHMRPSHRRPAGFWACRPGGLAKKLLLSHFARKVRESATSCLRADHYFGVLESGRMTRAVLEDIVRGLPEGISEINLHPGPSDPADPAEESAEDRRFRARPERAMELAALTDPSLRALCDREGIVLTTFRSLV